MRNSRPAGQSELCRLELYPPRLRPRVFPSQPLDDPAMLTWYVVHLRPLEVQTVLCYSRSTGASKLRLGISCNGAVPVT